MDAKPNEVEPDLDLEEALEQLESVDAADAPPLANDISDRLARALDSTEAP